MMRGKNACRIAFGFGGFGPLRVGPLGFGLNPWGLPRRSGWLVFSALSTGPKSEQEIKDYITKITGIQITYSLQPFLDYLASTGVIKKREDNKYELNVHPYWYVPI